MTTNTSKYSLASSSLDSSDGLKMSNQVIRLRDYKDPRNDLKGDLNQATVSGRLFTLTPNFVKKLFGEYEIYDEAEQVQYTAAEVQGVIGELAGLLQKTENSGSLVCS